MKNLKGPLILILIVAAGMAVYYYGKDFLFDQKQISTSDAKGNALPLKIGGDNYLGYWFIKSPKFQQNALKNGINVQLMDDGGAYSERLKKFEEKEYDAIVLPVNSYLEHGINQQFPGVIVAAISESKGADALVGFPEAMPNGRVNDLNRNDIEIVYTGASPSSFLVDLLIADFDLDALEYDKSWKNEVNSSEQVYKLAKKNGQKNKRNKAYVMWEPEVSKAIEKLGMKKLWGSDKFSGYIVDVLVFHRDIVSSKPEIVRLFLQQYFRIIEHYSMNKKAMINAISEDINLNEDRVTQMVSGIDWFTLHENASLQFGIKIDDDVAPQDRIISTILGCSKIIDRFDDSFNSLDIDPYKLINSQFLSDLVENGIQAIDQSNASVSFEPLEAKDWAKLAEVGTMRVEPIGFQNGADKLSVEGEEIVNQVANLLVNNYPQYRVIIRGHTGPGDASANQALSQKRAEIVLQFLQENGEIDANRLWAEGVGAMQPPGHKTGESPRAFRMRMPRVEFILVDEFSL